MRERAQHFDPRQTMHTDSFEVFHYREPRPNTVEVHHHDFYEVYYLLEGQVSYWVDGKILVMSPGDLMLIHPMELHRPVLEEGSTVYERIVLWIDRAYLERHDTPEGKLSSCFDPTDPNHVHLLRPPGSQRAALTELLGALVREHYSAAFASRTAAYGLFLQLMVQINRWALKGSAQREQAQSLSDLTQKVLARINENPEKQVSLDDLAEQFYVSKYHLLHTFTREVGVSVYRYIMLRRLLLARQLLAAGKAAGQVSRECGFSDYTSFYRAFRSEYGISPRDFASGN